MEKGYSEKISRRLWNLPDKGELESRREETFIDDIVQKDHLERRVLSAIAGGDIRTAFDGGAGSGRFSILLARHGVKVTHFDISSPMIARAKELAEEAGALKNMEFVEGALEDLSAYGDRQFDLVLSFDAPVSYTYPNQERVIGELARICKKKLLLSVSSRLGFLPYLSNPIQKSQFVLDDNTADPFARWCLDHRDEMAEGFHFDIEAARRLMKEGLMGGEEEIAEYERGGAPWCITYGFMPEELRGILERLGLREVEMAGPGAFARTVPHEILQRIMADPKEKRDFLDFCYEYDQNPYVLGMGKDNLFARAER
ncbi:class I SAM-dependent methyltransferase [Acutalibacter muris]|uniref:Class I SAM-dependent methyltransferase n=1 Tax=Acutalibacter muris TaxID=1796620 RepID=A0A1Z2XV35_9FIRM|nr:class I SAM-dependent methyltransferase [Acutalibacter muris]ANU54462.1 methyltransferase type 11 [Hungateiclostridiaceae bacterium KB18]ASB42317.1 class I SAM-dependent methyltransferase [Acutalibacter muris]MCI9193569.1 class I SAM-dependent methyltransferase [Acutalibacter muris]QQR31598.1 class I SAM-dependent methyltransferase [Acutalibacter muris]